MLQTEMGLEWSFLSPSADLFPGLRTGKFRFGTDQAEECSGRKPNLGRRLCDGDDRRGGEAEAYPPELYCGLLNLNIPRSLLRGASLELQGGWWNNDKFDIEK